MPTEHSTAYYSTTQHNTAPTAAQESLPPSLPPSLPSLPPLPPSLLPCHFPACVVEVREGMPVFLFQVFFSSRVHCRSTCKAHVSRRAPLFFWQGSPLSPGAFPPAYQGPNPKKIKIGGMLLRSLVSSGGGWMGHRSPRRPLDTTLAPPPHQFHMPPHQFHSPPPINFIAPPLSIS